MVFILLSLLFSGKKDKSSAASLYVEEPPTGRKKKLLTAVTLLSGGLVASRSRPSETAVEAMVARKAKVVVGGASGT